MDRILNTAKSNPSDINKKMLLVLSHRDYLENTSDIAYGSFKKNPKGICYCDRAFQKISEDSVRTEIQQISGNMVLVQWKYYGASWEYLEDLQFLFHDQPTVMIKQYDNTVTPSPNA